MKKIFILSTALLALVACQNNQTPTTTSGKTTTQAQHQPYQPENHYDTRVHNVKGKSYLCDNGFTTGITSAGTNQLLLSIAYGMPKTADVHLTRQNDGSYLATSGLFGKGAHWQETSAGKARLSYGMNDGRSATVICTAE